MGRKLGVLLTLSLSFAAIAIVVAVAALDESNDLSTSAPISSTDVLPADPIAVPAVERFAADQPPRHLNGPASTPEVTPPSTINPWIASEVASAVATAPPTTVVPEAPTPAITTPPIPATATPDDLVPITTAPPVPPIITVPPVAAPPVALLSTGTVVSARFVSDINALRASLGVAPLIRSNDLDARALEWSRVMASDGVLRHSGIIHSLVAESWFTAAENVGYGPTEETVFAALVVSERHYVNMINADFTHIGSASVMAGGTLWTTHIFAA